MNIPEALLYSKDHEWAKVEGDVATVGITDYAQGEMGDIVFVEMPQVGDTVSQSQSCGSLEAVKTVADIFSPFSGEVVEINEALEADPQLINQSPYDEGWIYKIKLSNSDEKEQLLTASDYEALLNS